MAETKRVYILGAGFNQCVQDWNGLKPPLASNFFQTILRSEKYQAEHYHKQLDCVYKYIEKYWKKSKEDLLNEPFNIEGCFTLLELQFRKAEETNGKDEMKILLTISFRLMSLFSMFLSEFVAIPEWIRNKKPSLLEIINQEPLYTFAAKIYNEKPIIITFNYDLILENAIKSISGLHPATMDFIKENIGAHMTGDIPDKLLTYSYCNWNLPLAYGFKFDEVSLQIPGVSQRVSGQRFYAHSDNKLYNSKILKLHGSINWFEYLGPMIVNLEAAFPELPRHKQGDVSLMSNLFNFNTMSIQDGWYVYPLLITPVLYKDIYYQRRPFPELWEQAKSHLSECTSLVVIGYSFAQVDWSTRQLMLEAFEHNQLQELIIVDPDKSVVKMVKELTHFTKPVLVCNGLEEFLRM